MRKSFLCLLFVTITLCCFYVRAERAAILLQYPNCITIDPSFQFLFAWEFSNTTFKGALSIPSTYTYFSAGWNVDASMIAGDFLVVTLDATGNFTLTDYYADSQVACQSTSQSTGACPDTVYGGFDNGKLLSAEVYNGYMTAQFERQVSPVDPFDRWVNFTTTSFLFAFGVYNGVAKYIPQHIASYPFPSFGFTGSNCQISTSAPTPVNSPTSAPTPAPTLPSVIDWSLYNYTYNADPVTIGWYLNGTSVRFAVSLAGSQGWVGFGFSLDNSGNMVPGEAYVCNNAANVYRYTLNDYNDADNPVPIPGAMIGKTDTAACEFVFDRNFTSVSGTYVINPASVTAIYAFSTSDISVAEHSSSDCGGLTMNLLTGQVSLIQNSAMVDAHGWLMWAAWAILVPIAASMARFLKKTMGEWWFRLHIILMVIAMMAVIASFGVIVSESRVHFGTGHSRLGLAIFIIAMLQPLIGFIADLMFDPNRTKTPIFPDIIHWILGWSVFILGLINIWTGIDLWNAPKVIYILWGIHFGLLVVVLITWAIVFQILSTK